MSIGSIGQMLDDMKRGVYDYTQDGKCSSCGQCCSSLLPVSKNEIKKIHAYIARKGIKERVNIPPTAKPVRDFTCPFRDNLKRICTIYEVRPAICRDFQCDKPRKKIEANRDLYHGQYGVVDMREEFYPKG